IDLSRNEDGKLKKQYQRASLTNTISIIGNLISECMLTTQGFTIRRQSDSKAPFLFLINFFSYHI
ncbi:hypothetical protein, partial [Enterococcus silesiacus]|uniref:hypothetical protein n=1 Tax=Enterococcus silesiacus TaxID=332949 RepID=UPI001C2809C5